MARSHEAEGREEGERVKRERERETEQKGFRGTICAAAILGCHSKNQAAIDSAKECQGARGFFSSLFLQKTRERDAREAEEEKSRK